MRVLALDTTTAVSGAALVDDNRVLAEFGGDPMRSHAEQLPAALFRLLDSAGMSLSAVDVLAVAVGPGSFTGLRIGIATMQGLAFVTGRRVVAVSALEALAHAASTDAQPGTIVAAWIDARRRQVFSALYRISEAPVFDPGRLIELDPPTVDAPGATLSRWQEDLGLPAVVVGDGAVAYRTIVDGRADVRPAPALASTIGLIGVHRARAGQAIGPGALQPLYVRRPDAEITRGRMKQGG
jgi:tRNA threonylcarbamoyladenosine biosynthesis protein TsaB